MTGSNNLPCAGGLRRRPFRRCQLSSPRVPRLRNAGAGLEPLAKVGDQPFPGAPELAAAFGRNVEPKNRRWVVGKNEALEAARGDMILDHVMGHVAPAETSQQEFQSGRQIGEAPEM